MAVEVQRTYKEDYFNPDDFVYFDHDSGTAVTHNGLRVFLATEDWILALQRSAEEQIGRMSAHFFYQIGYEWGLRHYQNIERILLANHKGYYKSAHDISISGFIYWIDRCIMGSGWGHLELVEENSRIFINLYNSAYAMMVGRIGRPACHVWAGVFAGAFSSAAGIELACIEILCYSMGADLCRFLLDGKEAVDATAFWVESGMRYEDILKNIQSALPDPKVEAGQKVRLSN